MINIFLPENNNLETYSENSLLKWLKHFNVSHLSDPEKPGYMLFELIHVHETGKIIDLLSAKELKRIQSGEVKLLLFYAREPITHHMLLPGLKELNDAGIETSLVILITGNFKITKDHTFPEELTVIPFFLFDLQTAMQNYTGRNYLTASPSRKFLCYNGVVKLHRTLMYLLLPHDQGHISYLKRKYQTDEKLEQLVSECPGLPADIKQKAIKEIHSDPDTIDLTQNEYIYNQFNDDLSLYDSTAFSIVTESIVDDWSVFITEKTFKPILSMHPFLIVSSPGTYTLLKSFGYETFDFLFPECINIDNEQDVYKKTLMVKSLVENFDMNKYHNNITQIKQAAEHNRNLCLNRDYGKRLTALIEKIVNQ